MAGFVLVHGSGQNAASWSRVGALLTARGHAVATPELPKGAPGMALEDHAAVIAASTTGPRTVVVAHSLCGVFLPLVAARADCALMVFLAAVIPEPGKSIRQQFNEDQSMFAPEWIASSARWFDDAQRESLSREFLFHDCDLEALPWALGTLEPIDTSGLVVQPSPLARWPDTPAASIVGRGDRTLSPEWIRRQSRRILGVEAIEVDAGHCPHMSRPREIADTLERLAALEAR
jgi:pimeloyl-ACP methyl ester carboxylesterase